MNLPESITLSPSPRHPPVLARGCFSATIATMSFLPVLIVIIVFGGAVFGAGAMLAAALPVSPAPIRPRTTLRIGLAGALALAVALTAGLLVTVVFGWGRERLDILLFVLLIGLLLAGARALGRRERGVATWPGRRELAAFAVVLALFAAPALVLPVPLDTDAQGFGYLALMLRDGGSLTTLAPFHPETEYLYSPGFPALAALLNSQLGIGLHTVQFAASAALALLFIWLLWDLGNEVEDWLDGGALAAGGSAEARPARHTGAALAAMGVIGLGLLTAYLDSHFTTVMALAFSLAFLIFVVRFLRGGGWPDALSAAVCLAAVPLTHPDTTIILILGYVPWLLTIWLARSRPTRRQWLAIAVIIPALAFVFILPWVLQIRALLGSSIESPFEISPEHWKTLVFMHGGLIVPLALAGAAIALRRRTPLDILMIGWLALLVDFSTTGILARLLPGLLAPLLKYDYPFSIAWHGPIIPYAYLGGTAALWLAGRTGWGRVRGWSGRLGWPALAGAGIAIALSVLFSGTLLEWSKGRLSFYGAFSSAADVQAMTWLKDNTPPETRILNHPAPQEGDWAPVVSERDTVYFRPQPFFRYTDRFTGEQEALYGFWEDPADPIWGERLRAAGIAYVLVPQVVGRPESFAAQWRWREPFAWQVEQRAPFSAAAYLELVADFDGAQVYRVLGASE